MRETHFADQRSQALADFGGKPGPSRRSHFARWWCWSQSVERVPRVVVTGSGSTMLGTMSTFSWNDTIQQLVT